MQKRIIINASAIETRVALVEGNALAELHIESSGERSIAGNIYKGKVLRVPPGMQAAFVEIGLEKAAFMHVSDFWRAPEEGFAHLDGDLEGDPDGDLEDEIDLGRDALETALVPAADDLELSSRNASSTVGSDDPEPASVASAEGPAGAAADSSAPTALESDPSSRDGEDDAPTLPTEPGAEVSRPREEQPRLTIEEALTKGQEILVQVSKEPIGSKGARITSHISLPGRYVVYMPTTEHIGVSRRIEDEKERKRLREIVASSRIARSGGFIIRTACEGVSKREILADMRFLARLWSSIVKKAESASAPALLHEDLDIVLRAMRDLFTTDVQQVVVDRPYDHRRITEFVDSVLQQRLKSRVELYDAVEPIFDHFSLENQVSRALERRVWLKSGGYLVVDQTEALTTIDVNTGRFVGKKTQEETVLKTNLEAARVAIDQLRLRNIGGIIIIDFIDMEKAANRKKVSEALAEAVKRDKARTNILRISELGLVQMTRKRTRDNLRQLITSPCPTCGGDGRLKSVEAMTAEVLRLVRREAAQAGNAAAITAHVAPEVAAAMQGQGPLAAGVSELEATFDLKLIVKPEPTFARAHAEAHVTATRPVLHAAESRAPAAAAAGGSPPEGS